MKRMLWFALTLTVGCLAALLIAAKGGFSGPAHAGQTTSLVEGRTTGGCAADPSAGTPGRDLATTGAACCHDGALDPPTPTRSPR